MTTPREKVEALRQLRDKYVEMHSMRVDHDSGDEDEAGARARMARLASRFPGSLREIDELELQVIRRRIVLLDGVISGRSEAQAWMEAQVMFHSLARGALHAKRWLAGRKRVDARLESAYEARAAASDLAADALLWRGQLARIASPPRGRLLDLVFARLAADLGTTHEQARALVFGRRRKRPAREAR